MIDFEYLTRQGYTADEARTALANMAAVEEDFADDAELAFARTFN